MSEQMSHIPKDKRPFRAAWRMLRPQSAHTVHKRVAGVFDDYYRQFGLAGLEPRPIRKLRIAVIRPTTFTEAAWQNHDFSRLPGRAIEERLRAAAEQEGRFTMSLRIGSVTMQTTKGRPTNFQAYLAEEDDWPRLLAEQRALTDGLQEMTGTAIETTALGFNLGTIGDEARRFPQLPAVAPALAAAVGGLTIDVGHLAFRFENLPGDRYRPQPPPG